jgi:hypothetical protein
VFQYGVNLSILSLFLFNCFLLLIFPNNSLSPVNAPKAPKLFGFDSNVAKVSVVVFASAVKLDENSSSKSADSPDDLLY